MQWLQSMARKLLGTCCWYILAGLNVAEDDCAAQCHWRRCKVGLGKKVYGYTIFYVELIIQRVRHRFLHMDVLLTGCLVTARVATKSMLASKNVRPNVTTPGQGLHWLDVLAGELHVRLRDAREISPGLWPKTLVLSHRTGQHNIFLPLGDVADFRNQVSIRLVRDKSRFLSLGI